jgi:hypothetical protein
MAARQFGRTVRPDTHPLRSCRLRGILHTEKGSWAAQVVEDAGGSPPCEAQTVRQSARFRGVPTLAIDATSGRPSVGVPLGAAPLGTVETASHNPAETDRERHGPATMKENSDCERHRATQFGLPWG